jgi:hypothetical protein
MFYIFILLKLFKPYPRPFPLKREREARRFLYAPPLLKGRGLGGGFITHINNLSDEVY